MWYQIRPNWRHCHLKKDKEPGWKCWWKPQGANERVKADDESDVGWLKPVKRDDG